MGTWGAFLPVWLLGTTLLLAIIDRMSIGGPRAPLSRFDFSATSRTPADASNVISEMAIRMRSES